LVNFKQEALQNNYAFITELWINIR